MTHSVIQSKFDWISSKDDTFETFTLFILKFFILSDEKLPLKPRRCLLKELLAKQIKWHLVTFGFFLVTWTSTLILAWRSENCSSVSTMSLNSYTPGDKSQKWNTFKSVTIVSGEFLIVLSCFHPSSEKKLDWYTFLSYFHTMRLSIFF